MNDTAEAIHGPEAAHANDQMLDLLRYLADKSGLEASPSRIRAGANRARAEFPGSDAQSLWSRLVRAAADLGLRVSRRTWSINETLEVVSQDTPVLTLRVPQPEASAEGPWVVLLDRSGDRVQVAGLDPAALRWVEAEELAPLVGAPDRLTPVGWGVTQAAMQFGGPPTDGGHGDDGHGDHGSHGRDHHPTPFRRLLNLMRLERFDLWMVVLFAIGVGVLSLAVPFTVQAIVNTILTVTDPVQRSRVLVQQVLILSIVLLACLGLAAVLRMMKLWLVELIQQRIFIRVAGDLAYRLPRVRQQALDRRHGPELVNRFFEVLTVQKAGSTLLMDGLVVLLQGSVGLVALFFCHESLLAFGLLMLLAIAFIVFVLGRGAVRTSIEESHAKYAVAGWLEEMVRQPLAFKQAGAQEYALERTDDLARHYLVCRRSHFRVLLWQNGGSLAVQVFASAGLLAWGGYLVSTGKMMGGSLVAAELILAVVVASLLKLGKSLESYYDLLAGMDKLGHLTDLPLEATGGPGAIPAGNGPAGVSFRDVTFAYDSHGKPILRNFSLTVRPGERLAVTGGEACGKSTLADLLYGLRTPQEGRVEVDGVDVRDTRPGQLREQVGLARDSEIFEGTVLENVTLGRPEVDLARAREALEAVGLLEEMLALPRGLQTPLSTGGGSLSDGQARRLTLARVLAGRPRLLVIDELLDTIDGSARDEVAARLFHAESPWTVIVLTHSPEVAQLCDRHVTLVRPAGH